MRERPLARSTDLIVEELGDEVLIYDTTIDRGHSLSPEAARVWRACNGKTPVEQLSSRLGLDQDTVNRALDELTGCDLLEVTPTIIADGSTRREVTVKMAKVGAAAAAAPLILSVAAPAAHAAVTRTIEECDAFTGQNCGGSTGCSSQPGCCCCTPKDQSGGLPGIFHCVPTNLGDAYCLANFPPATHCSSTGD